MCRANGGSKGLQSPALLPFRCQAVKAVFPSATFFDQFPSAATSSTCKKV